MVTLTLDLPPFENFEETARGHGVSMWLGPSWCPHWAEKARKPIKKFEGLLQIRVCGDGTPLASRSLAHPAGRALWVWRSIPL